MRYAHRTWGSSSTHLPFASSNFFFNPSTMTLLVASACPLHCGYAGVEYLFFMPNPQQYLWKALLSNWRQLSDMRVFGILNLVTIFHHTNFFTSWFRMLARGLASTHLVKQPVAMRRYWRLPVAFGSGPTISYLHFAKGHRLVKGLSIPPGWWIFGAYLWHLSHFLMNSWEEFCMLDYQYPWVSALCDKELPPMWLPQIPLWSFSSNVSTASGWTHSR